MAEFRDEVLVDRAEKVELGLDYTARQNLVRPNDGEFDDTFR